MSEVGNLDVVKEKMRIIISEADTALSIPDVDTHVKGKWRLSALDLQPDRFPLVTLRLGPITYQENIYGRNLAPSNAKSGIHASIYFTAHVWAKLDKTQDPNDEDLNDLADEIKDHLEQYIGDASSGILYFEALSTRPLEPSTGPLAYGRVAIEGYVFVNMVI